MSKTILLGVALLWLPLDALAQGEKATSEPLDQFAAEFPGVESLPQDILTLLKSTRDTYGTDAVLLQIQLLQKSIQAGAVLSSGVRVAGIRPFEEQRYLTFEVDTGLVFNSRDTTRQMRVDHAWSEILVPAIRHLESYDVPAGGIAVELSSYHRHYQDSAELEDALTTNPGTTERVTFYLLCPDLESFKRKDMSEPQLYSRSHPRVDDAPVSR